ncbi:hypothetical protein Q5P01_014352 [Channa striata]|uniref:Transmembrane protein 252 n=1 Tax=Channa striata TaxID=64152 RepID=A0AA88SF30_CHASR|nr:hypothetical protein Q5P01_014352 [Channa striata]
MNVKKQLGSLVRMILPGVGFALTCIGAYLLSHQTEYECIWKFISAYVLTAFGFLAILFGVFWTICHTMRSKIYHRGCNREQHIQIYTVERPSSFPPSYEESQESRARADSAPEFVVVSEGMDTLQSLAPPLYSQDSLEAPDCTWSWEQPPPYSQAEHIQRGQVGSGELGEAVSGH